MLLAHTFFWSIFRCTGICKLAWRNKNFFFFLHYSQNLRLFDTTRFIWTDGLQVMFVLQRTGKVKVRYEMFSFFPESKSSLFCGRSLGVVLLLVQTHLWVSGRPPPLWRLALATGSLRTGQTVTPLPAEAGRIVPNACKNYLVSLFRWSKSLTQRYSRLMPFLYFVNEVHIYEAVLEMPKIPRSFESFCEFGFHVLV